MEPFSEEELENAAVALVSRVWPVGDSKFEQVNAIDAVHIQAELNRCKAALAVYERTKAQADANDRVTHDSLPAYRVSVLREAYDTVSNASTFSQGYRRLQLLIRTAEEAING